MKKIINILSIGNSFSQDAQRYLNRIAKLDGVELKTFNLYIGGCPLSYHYRNMLSEERKYVLEMNGEYTGFFVSLKEALLNRDWDVITLQQVSSQAPCYDTYQPYLNELAEYIRKYAPKAKLAIHQTWAYEQDSERLNNELGYNDYKDMFADIETAYKKAKEDISAEILIPSGKLFCTLLENGIEKVHRDTFHASLGLGRYALGLLWYKVLTGNSIEDNNFSDFEEEITQSEIDIIKKCVTKLAQ